MRVLVLLALIYVLAILGAEGVVGSEDVGKGKETEKVVALENLDPSKTPWMTTSMLTTKCVPCMSNDVFVVSYCFSWPCRHKVIRDQ